VLTKLPNGLELDARTEGEARLLYHEMFEMQAYLRHGIEVADGATVFDVGANVGGFSASLAQQYTGLRLVLFEPIPETFAMLRTNADRLLQGADVTLVPKAVSSTVGTVTFETHPRSSFEASAYSDQAKAELRAARRADPGAWFRAGVQDARRAELVPERAARLIEGALDNRVARPVVIGGFTLAGTLGSLGRRFRSQRLECPTTTISAAMREHGIDRIDLLKIDVEGAEWDALVGIEEPDWPRIRQLAIEVHDVDGRVARIRDLLERMGYEVAVEEEDWETLRLRGLHMVFASR
jgi:31-O-methyltransferase